LIKQVIANNIEFCNSILNINYIGNTTSLKAENHIKFLNNLEAKGGLYNLQARALFLDLDIVIVDNIVWFFKVEGKFRIIKDQKWRSWRITGNSSVYRFNIGKHGDIFDDFTANFDKIII